MSKYDELKPAEKQAVEWQVRLKFDVEARNANSYADTKPAEYKNDLRESYASDPEVLDRIIKAFNDPKQKSDHELYMTNQLQNHDRFGTEDFMLHLLMQDAATQKLEKPPEQPVSTLPKAPEAPLPRDFCNPFDSLKTPMGACPMPVDRSENLSSQAQPAGTQKPAAQGGKREL